MSILSAVGELVPATAPVVPTPTAHDELITRMFFAALLAVAIGVGYAFHIFRADGIRGPDRVPANRPVWPLLVSMLVAVVMWVGVQTLYISARAVEVRVCSAAISVTGRFVRDDGGQAVWYWRSHGAGLRISRNDSRADRARLHPGGRQARRAALV